MGQDVFRKEHKEDDPKKHLYEMGMQKAKSDIERSAFFICIVPQNDPDNYSLAEQIAYAKKLRKPMYVLLPKGTAQPKILNGADVRTVQEIKDHKSIDVAVRQLFQVISRDFPSTRGYTPVEAPDLNDIVIWPPKKQKPEF